MTNNNNNNNNNINNNNVIDCEKCDKKDLCKDWIALVFLLGLLLFITIVFILYKIFSKDENNKVRDVIKEHNLNTHQYELQYELDEYKDALEKVVEEYNLKNDQLNKLKESGYSGDSIA